MNPAESGEPTPAMPDPISSSASAPMPLPDNLPAAPTSVPSSVSGSPTPVATGLAMKRRNPVAAWLGLPLITLGIYHLVWYYKIHREMAEFDRRRAVPATGPMLVLLLLGWTVIAPLVSYYNAGNRIRHAQRAAGLTETCSGLVGMLLMLVLGLGTLYYDRIEQSRGHLQRAGKHADPALHLNGARKSFEPISFAAARR